MVLLDRGQPVEVRGKDIGALFVRRQINPESNVCYGEGGAGTWSDGKLTTRIGRNSDPVRRVLDTLYRFGAPEVRCRWGAWLDRGGGHPAASTACRRATNIPAGVRPSAPLRPLHRRSLCSCLASLTWAPTDWSAFCEPSGAGDSLSGVNGRPGFAACSSAAWLWQSP